jgi:lysophospholipase L1-like esterase
LWLKQKIIRKRSYTMKSYTRIGMSCLIAGLASVTLAAPPAKKVAATTPIKKEVVAKEKEAVAKEKPAVQKAEVPQGVQGRPGKNYGKAAYHRSFMARIKQGPIGILFFGDSITEGIGKAGKETMLAKFEPYQSAVFGVGSEETGNLLYRLTTGEADITPNPKVVVLMIGVNDISHGKGGKPEVLAGNIKKNLDVIREKMPASKVLLMSLMPFGKESSSPNRQKVAAVNEVLKTYADGKDVIYVDVHSKFLDANGTVLEGTMDGASLHPTEKGYEVWHNALWPVAEPLLK